MKRIRRDAWWEARSIHKGVGYVSSIQTTQTFVNLGGRGRPGAWRLEVQSRAAQLRTEAAKFADSDTSIVSAVAEAEKLAVMRQTPVSWWSGSQVENAWLCLRLAEEALVAKIKEPTELMAQAASALAHAKKHQLPDDDPRVAQLRKEVDNKSTNSASILKVLQVAHESSDAQHRAMRAFRNRLRVVTVGLLALAVLTVAVIARTHPEGVLLPAPPELTRAWQVVLVAMILGTAGALFSAMPSLTQAPDRVESPFNPIVEQAALKVVVGAWSAIVGLIAVGAGVDAPVDGPTASSFAGFAMMCALFGASQEALTRFADRRASEVSAEPK